MIFSSSVGAHKIKAYIPLAQSHLFHSENGTVLGTIFLYSQSDHFEHDERQERHMTLHVNSNHNSARLGPVLSAGLSRAKLSQKAPNRLQFTSLESELTAACCLLGMAVVRPSRGYALVLDYVTPGG